MSTDDYWYVQKQKREKRMESGVSQKQKQQISIQKTFQFISSINGVSQTYKKAKIFIDLIRITAYRLE